ncbi:hypothetical protein [Terricaulis sp.]|uniref:hypothetical protein n=1 Tax=Terricaulis sp. TaxID=2768686 RepID=UPI0037838349
MRRILFASVAALALAATPVLAQQMPNPVPATPPVATPQPSTDPAPGENQPDATPQTPSPQATVRSETQTDMTPTPQAQTQTTTQAQTSSPAAQAQAQTTQQPDAASTAPDASAQAQVQAPATGADTPTPSATAESAAAVSPATAAAPMQDATGAGDTPTFTSAQSVCAPRSTSVHFGRGSSLSRQNQNAIEYATDAASVCNLQTVTIADSGDGRVSTRRVAAVRSTLVRQGVPEDRIQVEHATEGASTGQLDVRMTFAGAAQAGAVTASNDAATTAPTPTPGGS